MTGRAPSHHHTVVGCSGRLFRDDGLWMHTFDVCYEFVCVFDHVVQYLYL